MSIPTKFSTVVLVIFFISQQIHATTFITIIAMNGVVVSSDTQTTFFNPSQASTIRGEIQKKLFIVRHRIVVGQVGYANINDPSFHYDLLTWMQALDSKFPSDVSVDDVTATIAKESPSAIANFLAESIKQGTLKPPSPDQMCLTAVQFVVVGYQNGSPRLYEVQFDVDWNNKRLNGPITVLLHPQTGNTANYRVLHLGVDEAITDISNRKSYAYHQAMILCPKALRSVVNNAGGYPSLEDTIAFSRALIQIEEKTNPSEVGGPIETIKILPDGRADEVILDRTAPNALSKSLRTEKQKATQE